MKNPRSGSVAVVVTIIVLVLLGGGAYLYSQKSATSDVVRNPLPDDSFTTAPVTTDETRDWRTYTNEKYGFEFKYPDGFVNCTDDTTFSQLANQSGPGSIYVDSISGRGYNPDFNLCLVQKTRPQGIDNFEFNILTMMVNPQDASQYHDVATFIATANSDEPPPEGEELVYKTVNIDGVTGASACGDGMWASVCSAYLFDQKQNISIRVLGADDKSLLEPSFAKLLSTFRFTK